MERRFWAYALTPDNARPAGFEYLKSADILRFGHRAVQRAESAREVWETVVIGPPQPGNSPRHRRFTNQMGHAVVRKIVDDDTIGYLAAHSDVLADVNLLAEQIEAATTDQVFVYPTAVAQRKRLADHFWCDVVGSLVWVLEEADGAIGKVRDKAIDWLVDRVWDRFRASRDADWGATPNGRRGAGPSRGEQDRQAGITDELLKGIVKVWLQKLCDGVWAKPVALDALLLKLRVIALWLCPNAQAHKLVREHCLNPLARKLIDEPAQKLLDGVLPGFDGCASIARE